MTDRDSDAKLDKGQSKQAIGGQQSHESEYGEQGDQAANTSDEEIMRKEAFGGSAAQAGMGSTPPRSMGTHGAEFGQFGDHDDRGQAGGEVDQPGSYTQGEGFILKKGGPEEEDEASSEGGVG